MSAVHPKGDTLIGLGEIAAIINEWFQLEGEDTIDYNTPFVWWHRSQNNVEISHPMPEPKGQTGQRRSPFWEQAEILFWFGTWRGIEVPAGGAAGDRVDTRGRVYKGAWRRRNG